MKNLTINYIGLDKLIPYVNNSRTHDDAQIAQRASSIKEFGFTNPVLVDDEGGIIAGHGRVMAARKLNLKDVPTITLTDLTDIQKRAYIIADNKLALNAGWDNELLMLELNSLSDADFDLDLIGWDGMPEFEVNPDYSILDENDSNNKLQNMADGVKKAIQIEFDFDDYEEAYELVKFWRTQGLYVGQFLVQKLKEEKEKL